MSVQEELQAIRSDIARLCATVAKYHEELAVMVANCHSCRKVVDGLETTIYGNNGSGMKVRIPKLEDRLSQIEKRLEDDTEHRHTWFWETVRFVGGILIGVFIAVATVMAEKLL